MRPGLAGREGGTTNRYMNPSRRATRGGLSCGVSSSDASAPRSFRSSLAVRANGAAAHPSDRLASPVACPPSVRRRFHHGLLPASWPRSYAVIIPARRPGHDRPPVLTDRIWIAVEPVYTREHSAPPSRYVFVYFVRIKNIGEEDHTTVLAALEDPRPGGAVTKRWRGEGGCGRVPHLGAGRCARVLQLLRLGGEAADTWKATTISGTQTDRSSAHPFRVSFYMRRAATGGNYTA